jgi:hypothetical protein
MLPHRKGFCCPLLQEALYGTTTVSQLAGSRKADPGCCFIGWALRTLLCASDTSQIRFHDLVQHCFLQLSGPGASPAFRPPFALSPSPALAPFAVSPATPAAAASPGMASPAAMLLTPEQAGNGALVNGQPSAADVEVGAL